MACGIYALYALSDCLIVPDVLVWLVHRVTRRRGRQDTLTRVLPDWKVTMLVGGGLSRRAAQHGSPLSGRLALLLCQHGNASRSAGLEQFGTQGGTWRGARSLAPWSNDYQRASNFSNQSGVLRALYSCVFLCFA